MLQVIEVIPQIYLYISKANRISWTHSMTTTTNPEKNNKKANVSENDTYAIIAIFIQMIHSRNLIWLPYSIE